VTAISAILTWLNELTANKKFSLLTSITTTNSKKCKITHQHQQTS